MRRGSPATVVLSIANRSDGAQPSVDVSLPIPAGLVPAADPPFLAPVDPGADFDAATGTVSWSGALGFGETVEVAFQVIPDPAGACRERLSVRGGAGACSSDIAADFTLLPVPATPSGPYLMGVDLLEGLWQYRPEADPAPEPLLCVIPEILLGLAQGPDGETWVAGLPTLRFDPGTLALEFFPKSFYDVVGRGGTTDVVYDPTTATPSLVFTARNPTGVWRYDLETREVTPVPVDPGLGNLRRLEIDDGGRLWILADVGIVRFDPASGVTDRFPAPGVDFSFDTVPLGSPGGGGLVAFDLTAAGDAVALEESSFIAPPFEVTTLVSLLSFDPATGGYGLVDELLAARLQSSTPPAPPLPAFLDPLLSGDEPQGYRAAAIGPDSAVYVAARGIGRVQRGPVISGEELVATDPERRTSDIEWVTPGAPCRNPGDLAARPKPGKVDLTWTPTRLARYDVLRGAQPAGPFTQIGSATGGVFVDFEVAEGETWYYSLDVVCLDGTGFPGDVVQADVPTGDGRGACGLIGIEVLGVIPFLRRRRGDRPGR